MLQQRQQAELEDVNDKGQTLLSVKNIGQCAAAHLSLSDRSDQKYRVMFPFERFNPMQSKALEDVSQYTLKACNSNTDKQVYRGSQNLVLTAPTSAGKTTIFELALMKMIKEWEGYPEKRLAIYIAPTKASGRFCHFWSGLTSGPLLRTIDGLGEKTAHG